jgi:hypothetical protein
MLYLSVLSKKFLRLCQTRLKGYRTSNLTYSNSFSFKLFLDGYWKQYILKINIDSEIDLWQTFHDTELELINHGNRDYLVK